MTSFHVFAHFLRQANGRPQVPHTFWGKFSFLTPRIVWTQVAKLRPSISTRRGVLQKIQNLKVFKILKLALDGFNEDRAPRLGAALAYYTIFSLAPLLVIVIGIAGIVFDEGKARNAIISYLAENIPTAKDTIVKILDSANNRAGSGPLAITIGAVTSLAGAAGLFGQLQDSLNTVWGVKLKALPFLSMLKVRFISFAMVFGVAFLLLVSLVLSTAISTVTSRLHLADGWVVQGGNNLISFLVITLLFAGTYKVLPDAEIQWRDVWIGALTTSLLFTIGKYGLSIYLGHQAGNSIYGSASSLVLFLLWIYYAAQILFAGAEITKAYANLYGSKIKPSEYAVAVTEEERAQQGMERKSSSPGAKHPSDVKRDKAPALSATAASEPVDTAPGTITRPRRVTRADDIASVALGVGLAFFLYQWRQRRQVARDRVLVVEE